VIYSAPTPDAPLDQGDIVDDCPIVFVTDVDPSSSDAPKIDCAVSRIIVLTQTCDLANDKARFVTVSVVRDAQELIDDNLVRAADIRGPIRAGRVYGYYFLPANSEPELSEMIVDFHQLHTVSLEILTALCRQGKRRARVEPLYREHLARHFADTYSRIGLPEPYATE
jgi:hypothetical protein